MQEAVTQSLGVTKDVNGIPLYGTNYPATKYNFTTTLLATIEQTLEVPENVNIAVFAYSSPGVWSDQADTPPAAPLTLPPPGFSATGSRGQLDASVRNVTPGQTLQFITNVVAVEINVTFWAGERSSSDITTLGSV